MRKKNVPNQQKYVLSFLPFAAIFTKAGIIRKSGQHKVSFQDTVRYWKHHRAVTQTDTEKNYVIKKEETSNQKK